MKRTAYLVTREGRNFNKQGNDFIKEKLDKSFGRIDDLLIVSGPTYNKASLLADLLEQDMKQNAEGGSETCIVISRDRGKNTTYMGPALMEGAVKALRDPVFAGKTSWEILMEVTEEYVQNPDTGKKE